MKDSQNKSWPGRWSARDREIEELERITTAVTVVGDPPLAALLGIAPTAETVQARIDKLSVGACRYVQAGLTSAQFYLFLVTQRQPAAAKLLVRELARLRAGARLEVASGYSILLFRFTDPNAIVTCCEVFRFRLPTPFKALVALRALDILGAGAAVRIPMWRDVARNYCEHTEARELWRFSVSPMDWQCHVERFAEILRIPVPAFHPNLGEPACLANGWNLAQPS